jgi:hypothetical protein
VRPASPVLSFSSARITTHATPCRLISASNPATRVSVEKEREREGEKEKEREREREKDKERERGKIARPPKPMGAHRSDGRIVYMRERVMTVRHPPFRDDHRSRQA